MLCCVQNQHSNEQDLILMNDEWLSNDRINDVEYNLIFNTICRWTLKFWKVLLPAWVLVHSRAQKGEVLSWGMQRISLFFRKLRFIHILPVLRKSIQRVKRWFSTTDITRLSHSFGCHSTPLLQVWYVEGGSMLGICCRSRLARRGRGAFKDEKKGLACHWLLSCGYCAYWC